MSDGTSNRVAVWASEQIKNRLPAGGVADDVAIQGLVSSLASLRSGGGQVFGMASSHVASEDVDWLADGIRQALLVWKEELLKREDRLGFLELDSVARRLQLPELELRERFALRCDPLGTTSGLSSAWAQRLQRLEEAREGKRRLAAESLRIASPGDAPSSVEFGLPDPDSLYRFALGFERGKAIFPREIAATWTIANGIFFDETPFLLPVSDWTWEDRDEGDGLRIGAGHYSQGSLVVLDSKHGPLAGPVIDSDDDGVVAAKYANFAALLDTMLGGN